MNEMIAESPSNLDRMVPRSGVGCTELASGRSPIFGRGYAAHNRDMPDATQPDGYHSTVGAEKTRPGPDQRSVRLHRSSRDRMLGGVAGGVAETYQVDPSVVRLAFVLLVLAFGAGILAYVIAWIILPLDDGSTPVAGTDPPARAHVDTTQIAGIVLVLLGAVIALDRIGWGVRFDLVVAVLLIAGGVALLARIGRGGDSNEGSSPSGSPSPAHQPGPAPPDIAAESRDQSAEPVGSRDSDAVGDNNVDTAPVAERRDPPGERASWAPAAAWERDAATTPHATPPPPPPSPSKPRPRSILGRVTVGALLVFFGTVALLDVTGVLESDPAAVLAIALTGIGASLLLGGWFGRARGLIALGIVVAIVTAGFALVDVPLRGGIGDRDYRPLGIDDVRDEYRLGIGQLTVDLRALDVDDDTVELTTSLGIGELVVVVPEDAALELTGSASAGEVILLDRTEDGLRVDTSARRVGAPGSPTFVIDAEVGFGSLKVLDESSLRVLNRSDLAELEGN